MKERRRAARILKAVTEATLSFAPERGKEGLAHLSLRELAKSASVAPNNASTLLLYYIYQQGFTNFNYGVSSALTVIMLGLLLVVSLPRFISQDKKIHYN